MLLGIGAGPSELLRITLLRHWVNKGAKWAGGFPAPCHARDEYVQRRPRPGPITAARIRRSRAGDAALGATRQAVRNVEPAEPAGHPVVRLGLEGLRVVEDPDGQVSLPGQPLVLEGDRGPAPPAEGAVDTRRGLEWRRLAARELHLLRPVAGEERDRRAAGAAAVPAVAVDDDGRVPNGPHRDRPAAAPALGRAPGVRALGVPLRYPAHPPVASPPTVAAATRATVPNNTMPLIMHNPFGEGRDSSAPPRYVTGVSVKGGKTWRNFRELRV